MSLITTAAFAAVPPGSAGEPFAASRSYLRAGEHPRQVWLVCAPLDGADMTVVGLPAGSQLSIVRPLSGDKSTYRLGRPDPGAGQVYWPLSDRTGKEVGALHAFNPGVLGDPKLTTTPTFVSIRVDAAQWNCRWLERTRLLGFSKKRVVEITSGPGGLEYQSFDFKDSGRLKRIDGGVQDTTSASLDIKGGRDIGGRMQFDGRRYSFRVIASAADARIVVIHGGRTILDEPLVAWTIGSR